MNTKPYASSILLALNGIILMGLGLYFVFLRPALLPEDPRFMGTTLAEIQASLSGLLVWLRRVFWVTLAPDAHPLAPPARAGVGGFILATGLLLLYLAQTTFRAHLTSARLMVALAALGSIGWMAVVNFMIASDFKWLLLTFNLPWISALVLSLGERRKS
ncbi:MAG TPA: hypothetical protein VK206_04765 [Anaerolineales bacterium]|nr:hypothetical protein [Anaerolineales bacterium]HLO30526.1 hypothetical protein [Anaerolineales bacterium]